ncbi:MAG: translation initiation factor IF-1 [Gammaproteobacteria bacterium]|nr:translation initiation factor IF-1 [Gammaproteobacteria bacterium]
MSKEDILELKGTVIETLRNEQYHIKLENGHKVLAYVAGKMRRFRIRIVAGDTVTLEMSPYDLTKGRIIFRDKT